MTLERRRRATSLAGLVLPGGVRLDAAVAEGASGVVLRGWHELLDRPVAVKVTHTDDELAVARALREARIVASIDAPGIVRVYEGGRLDDGRAWIAMEWIDGVTLEEAAADAPWTTRRVAATGARLARALARAHAAGVVHRDLKPANVIVRASGEIVIVDFGIARAPGELATSQSRVAGTPHYMAPEQALGEAVDGRTDLYALGCVLYRLATGVVPYDGAAIDVMLAHLGQPPPALDGLDPGLGALVGRLLAKRPTDRPADADEVAAALEAIARTGVRPATTAPREPVAAVMLPPPPTRRRTVARQAGRGLALAIATVAAALSLASAFYQLARGLRGDAPAAVAGPPAPGPPPAPPPVAPSDPVVLVVDGGFAMRATLPAAPLAGSELVIELAIWDAEGRPIAARQVAVTVRDPRGEAIALAVRGKAGVFRVRQRAAVPGTYVVTAFAPSGETTFAVSVEVGSSPAA